MHIRRLVSLCVWRLKSVRSRPEHKNTPRCWCSSPASITTTKYFHTFIYYYNDRGVAARRFCFVPFVGDQRLPVFCMPPHKRRGCGSRGAFGMNATPKSLHFNISASFTSEEIKFPNFYRFDFKSRMCCLRMKSKIEEIKARAKTQTQTASTAFTELDNHTQRQFRFISARKSVRDRARRAHARAARILKWRTEKRKKQKNATSRRCDAMRVQ